MDFSLTKHFSDVRAVALQMEKVFFARGVPLPPWRSPRVMQGR